MKAFPPLSKLNRFAVEVSKAKKKKKPKESVMEKILALKIIKATSLCSLFVLQLLLKIEPGPHSGTVEALPDSHSIVFFLWLQIDWFQPTGELVDDPLPLLLHQPSPAGQ